MALFIVFIVLALASLGYGIFRSWSIVKYPHDNVNFKREFIYLISFSVLGAIFFTLCSFFIYSWQNISPFIYESVQAYVGGFIFFLSLSTFIFSFLIHYYRDNLPKKIDKALYIIMLVSVPIAMIMFFLWSNGYADYMTYPIPNGVWFTTGFTYPGPNTGNHIAFYAICILSGAVFVYFLCDHRFYQQYGKHGIVESTFFVSFPAGIIGARIGYVIGNWNEFKDNFGKAFDLRTGGLTIVAGALIGIIVGVLWFKWRRKEYSIWVAVDLIVPTILLAQAIGRWGNFFNVEVHGWAVDEKYYTWLPKVIFNNMHYSSSHYIGGELTKLEGQIYVPLFLIESLTNTIGYFVIAYVFGRALRKYTELGDLAFGYIVWYGLTRVIMEPLRDSSFNMGNKGYWSWVWALIFVAGGALLIVINHLIRYFLRMKKGNVKPINLFSSILGISLISIISISFIIYAIILLTNNPVTSSLAYTPYTIGLIFLVVGLSILIFVLLPIERLYFSRKMKIEKRV